MPVVGTIALLGDLMQEIIDYRLELPPDGQTTPLRLSDAVLGGAAFNVAWHLAHLKFIPKLVAPVGSERWTLVGDQFRRAGLSAESLIEVPGSLDLLVVVTNGLVYRSVYLLMDLEESLTARLRAAATADIVVFTGSRHVEIQRSFASLPAQQNRLRIFSPSYALYAMNEELLNQALRDSHITIVNRNEASWLARRSGAQSYAEFATTLDHPFIVTKDAEGAELWQGGRFTKIESASGMPGDAMGAGDAFTAGLVIGACINVPLLEACRIGAVLASFIVRRKDLRTRISQSELAVRLKEAFGLQFPLVGAANRSAAGTEA